MNMAKGKVQRNTAAMIGWIVALIAAILLIAAGVVLIADALADVPLLKDMPDTTGLDRVPAGVIAILAGIAILVLEFDKIVLKEHLIRGVLYIVVGLIAFSGLLLIVSGICYLIAAYTK